MARIYQLPPEVLRTDAATGSRSLALALLDEVKATIPRISDPTDTEALHDFRVSVRRLRACLRAYAPLLGGEGVKPHRRAIRSIVASTTDARDAEVLLEWVAARRESLTPAATGGVATIVNRLTETKIAGYHLTGRSLEAELPAVESDLREYLTDATSHESEGFTQYLWRAVAAHADDLETRLAGVAGMFDGDRAHRARISAKRLRYLIEPLVTEIPFTQGVVDRLTGFQDLVGDLRDRQLMGHVVRQEIERLQGDRDRLFEELSSGSEGPAHQLPPELAGLMELARLSRCEEQDLYRPLEREWFGAAAGPFFKAVRELADRISLIIPQLI